MLYSIQTFIYCLGTSVGTQLVVSNGQHPCHVHKSTELNAQHTCTFIGTALGVIGKHIGTKRKLDVCVIQDFVWILWKQSNDVLYA